MSTSSKKRRVGFTLVEMLVVIAVIGILVSLIVPAVQAARESARRAACQNNMKQLGTAVYAYHDFMRKFPPMNATLRQSHSWAPYLLVHLEMENLADKYSYTVDWNDAQNQEAIRTKLEVLQCPSAEPDREVGIGGNLKAATTDYGPVGTFNPQLIQLGLVPQPITGNLGGIMVANGAVQMADVGDGASNTLVFVEDAGRPEFWVKGGLGPDMASPGCGRYPVSGGNITGGAAWADPGNGVVLDGFVKDGLTCPGKCAINCTNNSEAWSFHPTGMSVCFGDGSVRFLNQEIGIEVYAALITRDGGEILDDNKY